MMVCFFFRYRTIGFLLTPYCNRLFEAFVSYESFKCFIYANLANSDTKYLLYTIQ